MAAPAPLALPETIVEIRRRFPVGTTVRYWPGDRRGAWIIGRTRSLPWLVAGVAVVALEGGPKAAAISALEPHEDQDLVAGYGAPTASLVSGVPGGRSQLERELLDVLSAPAAGGPVERRVDDPLPELKGTHKGLDGDDVRRVRRILRLTAPMLSPYTTDEVVETLLRDGWTRG